VAWPQSEVEAVNRARIAGMTDKEIIELVTAMHQARGAGDAR
jgi:hypothetical protein